MTCVVGCIGMLRDAKMLRYSERCWTRHNEYYRNTKGDQGLPKDAEGCGRTLRDAEGG